jgi:hypothetical protein
MMKLHGLKYSSEDALKLANYYNGQTQVFLTTWP